MTKLKISQQVLQAMTKDVTDSFQKECCGFLFGLDEGQSFVTDFQPLSYRFVENQSKHFKISDAGFQAAEKYAEANGLEILGTYRSRPFHPAVPSFADLQSALPFMSLVILSVGGTFVDAVTSWKLDLESEEFYEEEVEITADALVAARGF